MQGLWRPLCELFINLLLPAMECPAAHPQGSSLALGQGPQIDTAVASHLHLLQLSLPHAALLLPLTTMFTYLGLL